jgi:predicted nuclease of predicted toxin-antitoxin system
MKFLLDESCDTAIATALDKEGHDVSRVSQVSRGATDEEVVKLALEQNRILLTEDKDFGQLVYATGEETCGVILFRFPFGEREVMARKTIELVEVEKEKLQESFVVLELDKIRIRRKNDE